LTKGNIALEQQNERSKKHIVLLEAKLKNTELALQEERKEKERCLLQIRKQEQEVNSRLEDWKEIYHQYKFILLQDSRDFVNPKYNLT
jgi:hypothetical protein